MLLVNMPCRHNGGVFLFLRGVSDVQSSTNKSIWGGILTFATASVTSEFNAITELLWQTDNNDVLPQGNPPLIKTMISLLIPGIPWLFEIPSTMLGLEPLLFTIGLEDGERGRGKQNDLGRKCQTIESRLEMLYFGPNNYCFKFYSGTTKPQ